MIDKKRRRPVPDRARKRAIRTYAAQAGVSYLVAARQLDGSSGLEPSASRGRTVYPHGADEHRRWLVETRERWSYDLRVRDTRRAAVLPTGRAQHLVERFPVMRTDTGVLYDGPSRTAALGLLYIAAMHECPLPLPSSDEVAWLADLGEETAVDVAFAGLDRVARGVLDADRWTMWTRIEAALATAERSADRLLHWSAVELAVELRELSLRSSVEGARHTLDALLISAEAGHAPGTRVRLRAQPYRGRTATIVGARWATAGPPVAYDVRPDAIPATLVIEPGDLTLLDPAAAASTLVP